MARSNEAITKLPLSAAVNFLNRRVDFERFSRIPDPARAFRLDRMRTLLSKLGNPQDALPIVHVTGTKGKGSTSTMIAAVLSKAGYRTGLFTSPHLEKVEERIVLDGRQCSEAEFIELIEAVRPAVEQLDHEAASAEFEDIGPTYFEILTAMALLYFRRQNATAVVLEVGLGGRLDSTNVCLPKVSVITSISFDHTAQLGNTLTAIAREKGGIIKPGIPVVNGVTEGESRSEIRRIAREIGAPLIEAETDFHYEYSPPKHVENGVNTGILKFFQKNEALGQYDLSLLGRHQAENAAVVLAVIVELRRQGWVISEKALREGLRGAILPARIEVIARRPAVILDSAHNAASIAALVATLRESFSVRKRHLIFATTKEKDNRAMMQLLLDAFDEVYLTRYTTNPRFVPPEELGEIAYDLKHRRYPLFSKPAEAWQAATQNATAKDLICITGSFFLAGELRRTIARGK